MRLRGELRPRLRELARCARCEVGCGALSRRFGCRGSGYRGVGLQGSRRAGVGAQSAEARLLKGLGFRGLGFGFWVLGFGFLGV